MTLRVVGWVQEKVKIFGLIEDLGAQARRIYPQEFHMSYPRWLLFYTL